MIKLSCLLFHIITTHRFAKYLLILTRNPRTNPQAMETIKSNTVFTNVAETSDGGVYWEGLEDEVDLSDVSVTSWLGQDNWSVDSGKPSSHPNSR